jgi:hypothetical protein
MSPLKRMRRRPAISQLAATAASIAEARRGRRGSGLARGGAPAPRFAAHSTHPDTTLTNVDPRLASTDVVYGVTDPGVTVLPLVRRVAVTEAATSRSFEVD